MNIDGHEVEARGLWYDVDGREEWRTDTPAEFIEGYVKSMEAKILRARALIEYKRREAAEKAAQDAADELDRRAKVARRAWAAHVVADDVLARATRLLLHPDQPQGEWDSKTAWREVVRALDADAAERDT